MLDMVALHGPVFISYEPVDGLEAALWIAENFDKSTPPVSCWTAEKSLRDTDNAIEETAGAIQSCSCFILVATKGAVSEGSNAAEELKRAFRYKKAILVASVEDCELPPRLARRPQIVIKLSRQGTFEALRASAINTATEAGLLTTLEHYKKDAEEAKIYLDLDRDSATRIDNEVNDLNRAIASLTEALSDPDGVRHRLDQRIQLGVEHARAPHQSPSIELNVPVVNKAPIEAPDYFQNRFDETQTITDFIKGDSGRLLFVTGQGGVGKSALVCRVLCGLERGNLPDNQGKMRVGGIVYLSFLGQKAPSLGNMFEGLVQTLPRGQRQPLLSILEGMELPVETKVSELLSVFSKNIVSEPVLILLDNMEDTIDTRSHEIRDPEVSEFLRQLLHSVGSRIKVLLTSRIVPVDFREEPPGVQVYLPLDEGLTSPYAETVLRALDKTGSLGLKDADAILLGRLQELTRGYPRAMEAVAMILAGDRSTTINDVLESPVPDDRIINVLVGEAFSRLDYSDQMVMEALAIFDQPVPPIAVEHILRPWFIHIDAALSLRRLANKWFVRKEGERYFQHPIDRQYALRMLKERTVVWRIPDGDQQHDLAPPKTVSLEGFQAQAAEYFSEIELPPTDWRKLSDIEPNISQFHLRLDLADDDSASVVLASIAHFLEKRGAFQQLLTLATILKEKATSVFSRETALDIMARAQWRMGRTEEALSLQNRLIQEVDGGPYENPKHRLNAAIYSEDNGNVKTALEVLEEAHDQLHLGDQERVILDHLGSLYLTLGHFDRAIQLKKDALVDAEASNDLDEIEAQTHNLADSLEAVGCVEEALTLYRKALQLADKTENPLWRANHLSAIADIQWDKGDTVEAATLLDEATAILQRIGGFSEVMSCEHSKAKWLLLDGDATEAERKASEVKAQSTKLRRREYTSDLLLARVKATQSDWEEVERLARVTLETHIEESTIERRTLLAIAFLYQNKAQQARSAFNEVLAEATERISRSDRNSGALAHKALSSIGLATLGGTGLDDAIASYRQAREINDLPGTIRDRQWWFNLLEAHPSAGDLTRVQEALDGIERPMPAGDSSISSENTRIGAFTDPNELPLAVRESIVAVLARLASSGPTSANEYFDNLIRKADLPVHTRTSWINSWGPDPDSAARKLVNGFLALGSNPKDQNNSLGTVLLALLPELYIEDAALITATVVGYRLLSQPSQLDDLQKRFQLPARPSGSTSAQTLGPAFDWADSPDEATLQNWLRPGTDFLDVHFLCKAIDCARSVCRIEVQTTGETGTGVLISPDLVLTSHHLLGDKRGDLKTRAASTALHFGTFTRPNPSADGSQTVPLADVSPIVATSTVHKYDFVLLRAGSAIKTLSDVKPATLSNDTPKRRDPLHILQHPSGGSMKLAISHDGVTSVHPRSGKVQYVTRTAGGSSGSPCFDSNWNVVALHRAEIVTPLGARREGVLVRSIYPQIERYLV